MSDAALPANGISASGKVIGPAPTDDTVNWRHWLGFSILLVGQFMAVLDIQIVASSLGELRASLGATVEEIALIQSTYLVAEVIMIPLSAWLARLLSIRIMFAASAAFFVVTSVLCASAWNLESMLVFRAMQGFSAGALTPLSFATIFFMFPRSKHAIGVAIAGMITTTGITLGPIVGGWVTLTFSWHWIFFMNIVPGLIVVFGVLALIDVDRPQLHILPQIDIPGVVLAGLFLGSLVILFDKGPENDWFDTPWITRLTVVMVISGILFLWRELTCRYPVIELRLFTDSTFAAECICSFVLGAAIVGSAYLSPAMLSTVRHFNSQQIGTVMMFTGAAQVLLAPLASYMVQRLAARVVLGIGLSILITSLIWHGQMTSEMGLDQLAVPQFLRGLGIMMCFMPITIVAIGSVPLADVRTASSLFNLFRSLGGAIGLALITTFQESRFDFHRERLLARVGEGGLAAEQWLTGLQQRIQDAFGSAPNPEAAALKIMNTIIEREVWVLTFNDMWMAMAFYCGLSALFLPFLPDRIRQQPDE
ncbi:MAG: DHA2 family efflux MFS transporter permease subunit [Alphaproteobacteria bacterium]|nr:DHA2 family efflux MFS transporter permease subunit [Alphaproteobacteria bacterium]